MSMSLSNKFFSSHSRYVTNMSIIAMRRTAEMSDGKLHFADQEVFRLPKVSKHPAQAEGKGA